MNLLDRIVPPSPVRFALLKELPLTEEEKIMLARIEAADSVLAESGRLVHLPMFIINAEKV